MLLLHEVQVVIWTPFFFFFSPFFGIGVHTGGGRLIPPLYEGL